MEKKSIKETITIDGKNIIIDVEEFFIRIYNDDTLKALLAHDTEIITQELVSRCKAAFLDFNQIELTISDDSMAVEIWGHVYVDKFAEAVKNFSSVELIDKLAEKIMYHCDRIDIGEHAHDENRFIWDVLAPFKSAIAKLLPKK